MIRSPENNSDFFKIFAGVLQGDTLALYLPRLRTSNVDWSNKRKGLYTKKKKKPEADNIREELYQM